MRIIYRDANLDAIGRTEALAGEAFTGESGGHKFVITARRGGQIEALNGNAYGIFIAPNGDGIALTEAGIDSEGRAWAILDAACYQQRGSFGIRIFNAGTDETVTAIWSGAGYMSVGEPETIYDPGDVINIAAIEAKIAEMDAASEACEEATASAQQAASFVNSIIAPTYSPGVTYVIGNYCTYEGSMYRCTNPTGGDFDPDDWDQVLVGSEFNRVFEDIDNVESNLVGRVLSDEIKIALLACFQHVAWTTPDGQDYYDALASMLNPPANLSYISVSYTQTMTVMDNDPLSVLRPDLTVTAHYTDSSSSRIYGYLLSGTLVAGTSSVTVSYGGKTTTFNVTVTPSYIVPGRTYALTDSSLWQMHKGMTYGDNSNNKPYEELVHDITQKSRAITILIPIAQTGIKLTWNGSDYKIVPTGWYADTKCSLYAFQGSVTYITNSPVSYSESTITSKNLSYFTVQFGENSDSVLSSSDLSALNLQLEVL